MSPRGPHDPYPHLAPESRLLDEDALAVWGDTVIRQRMLDEILDAWRAGPPALAEAIERVDASIVRGLAVLGLPRGEIRGRVRVSGTTLYEPAGQKFPDCEIRLSGTLMERMVRTLGYPDDSFRTWVHESLHARHVAHPGAAVRVTRHGRYALRQR